ncbi:MAG: hypothetical protein KDB61_07365 [Planctomycetes bacterium]|nr:hypothetical protein [Planctomycetota bacterium]
MQSPTKNVRWELGLFEISAPRARPAQGESMTELRSNPWLPTVPNRWHGVWIAMLLPLVCIACSAPQRIPAQEPALVLPAGLENGQGQYVGSLLSGPVTGAPNMDALLSCSIQVVLLRKGLDQSLSALAPQVGVVAQVERQVPIQGGSRLAIGSRWAQGPDAEAAWAEIQSGAWGDTLAVRSQEVLVPQGTTFQIGLSAQEHIEDPENFLREWPDRPPVRKELSVGVHFAGNGADPRVAAGFALADLAPAEGEQEQTEPPLEGGRPGADRLLKEWVVPEPGPNPMGDTLLWWLPCPFETIAARSVVVRVEIRPVDPAGVAAGDLAACAKAVIRAPERSGVHGQVPSEVQAMQTQKRRAIANAKRAREASIAGEDQADRDLRAALVFLCSQAEGSLGNDLCLLADLAMLRGWVALIPDPSEEEGISTDQLSWGVERAAWTRIAREMVQGELPGELLAIVLRHAGEAGHYPSTLEDAARTSADWETFQQRLLHENRLFLEESSPAARVRAFDWLQRRGEAPADWDPLAPREQRRAPLRAWLATFENGGSR